MLVRKLRLQRGWSQEQLAEMADVSVRTIQRIERGQKPGLETAKALASVFEVELSVFLPGETSMQTDSNVNQEPLKLDEPQDKQQPNVELKQDEAEAIQYVKGIKEFYTHAFMFVVFAITIPIFKKGPNEAIVFWGLLGWGIGVIIHGLVAFEKINFIGALWEKKQIEKRLGRKL